MSELNLYVGVMWAKGPERTGREQIPLCVALKKAVLSDMHYE
jgi:hypothetical protein